jgi:hypothetical protein
MNDYLSNVDASTFNSLFVSKLNGPEGIHKTAQATEAFIRDKLRETSFARKILPPIYVTKVDLQRSVNHDLLVKIDDIEAKSGAMALNFRGKPTSRYISGKRFEIPFFKISSEKFTKNEAELLAYNYPITKVIEDNSIKDIQSIEDTQFLKWVDSAIGVTGKKVTTGTSVTHLDRISLNYLIKMIDGDELAVGTLLCHKVDYDDFMVQDGSKIGTDLAGDITVNGYKYSTILGHKLVVSIKTSILNPGNVYAFTDPKYFGNFYVLNDTKFYIEKKADMISWQTWEYIGIGFGNLRGASQLYIKYVEDIPGVWNNPHVTTFP